MFSNSQKITLWKKHKLDFYDFAYQNILSQPCTSVQWGNPLSNQQHRVYFTCNSNNKCYLFAASTFIPPINHTFNQQHKALLNQQSIKRHQNLNIKAMIQHPGDANVIRFNGKYLATKNDSNNIYGWVQGKKSSQWIMSSIKQSKQSKPNFVLVWAYSLPRLISSSGKNLEVYDLLTNNKRQLNLSLNAIPPVQILNAHQNFSNLFQIVQDACFKNQSNELISTVGLDRKLLLFDLRINKLVHQYTQVHKDDINAVCWINNNIITGGNDSQVIITDIRNQKKIIQKKFSNIVVTLHFSSDYKYVGIGSDNLYIISNESIINNNLEILFTHFGSRGLVNDFQWNNQDHMSIIHTCQQIQPECGYLYLFRPLNLLLLSKEQIEQQIKRFKNQQ